MLVRSTLVLAVLSIGLATPHTTSAQGKTIWHSLGIPQAYKWAHGQTVNRFGKHPKLEPKPPLKAIADPANLLSDNPAIKAAAEIKMAEDLAPQKVKALKYLASIGCGCYNKDGKITAALVAAMDPKGECTDKVRLAAVKAIEEAAEEGCCVECGTSCCNEDITAALSKSAYEKDETGCCWYEPSERVREAAKEALNVCCPNRLPPNMIRAEEVEGATPEAVEGADEPMTDPNIPKPEADDESVLFIPRQANTSRRTASQYATMKRTQPTRPTAGAVVTVDLQYERARVHFLDRSKQLAAGTPLQVFQRNPNGPPTCVGELVVTQSATGMAFVSPVGDTQITQIRRGDVVVARQDR